MLIEFLETFLGAYFALIPEDYSNRNYFASILSIIILSIVCISCFVTMMIIIHHCFKIFTNRR